HVLDVLRNAGTTTLFVTHDQDEALSSADQVAVMVDGRVAQAAAPRDLYARPASPDVALFLGSTNLVEGTFAGPMVRTALGSLELEGGPARSGPAVVLVRPEQLEVLDPGPGVEPYGEVVGCEFYGHDIVVRVRGEGAGGLALLARMAGDRALGIGTQVGLRARGPVVAWGSAGDEISPPASENTSM
ncbi:MAG: TOBE domain-containing protein, partial [Acidimicrobiales bacterium]